MEPSSFLAAQAAGVVNVNGVPHNVVYLSGASAPDGFMGDIVAAMGALVGLDLAALTMQGNQRVRLAAAHALGSELHDPFMAMSFMALEVIPHLKLTDVGLVDVDRFEVVPLFVD